MDDAEAQPSVRSHSSVAGPGSLVQEGSQGAGHPVGEKNSGNSLFASLVTPFLSFGTYSGKIPLQRRRCSRFSRRPVMGKKLYVGNLAYSVTDSDLQAM